MSSCSPLALTAARIRASAAASGVFALAAVSAAARSVIAFHSPSDARISLPPRAGSVILVHSGSHVTAGFEPMSPIARLTASPPG